jgi:hypothetical protein
VKGCTGWWFVVEELTAAGAGHIWPIRPRPRHCGCLARSRSHLPSTARITPAIRPGADTLIEWLKDSPTTSLSFDGSVRQDIAWANATCPS